MVFKTFKYKIHIVSIRSSDYPHYRPLCSDIYFFEGDWGSHHRNSDHPTTPIIDPVSQGGRLRGVVLYAYLKNSQPSLWLHLSQSAFESHSINQSALWLHSANQLLDCIQINQSALNFTYLEKETEEEVDSSHSNNETSEGKWSR